MLLQPVSTPNKRTKLARERFIIIIIDKIVKVTGDNLQAKHEVIH